MTIRCRPMRPFDVYPCAEIVAQHPMLSSRYEATLADLGSVWRGLLGSEAFRAYVCEDLRDCPRLVGIGCSAIISDDFLMEAKTPPFFWIGPELTRRVCRGQSALLSDKQVRGFSPGEQRLLLTALLGGTDEDLADELGISLSAVKKAWLSIYERVSIYDPKLVPSPAPNEEGIPERGKMKKHRLLAYLHDHPEELRPAAP